MCMNKKYMCLISVILLLGVVGNTTAAYNQYSGTYDGDWNTAANWDLGYIPTIADKAGFKTVGGPLVVTSTPTCDQWTLGGVNGGIVTIDTGGTVETLGRVSFAQSSNEDGTLVMNDGTATFGGILDLGYVGTGHIDLNGGTINAADFRMRELGGVGTMDIHEGTLIIGGDKTTLVNGYISSGWIIAHGGMGNVIVMYDGGSDSTMLTGIMDPNKAKLLYPTNNAVGVAQFG